LLQVLYHHKMPRHNFLGEWYLRNGLIRASFIQRKWICAMRCVITQYTELDAECDQQTMAIGWLLTAICLVKTSPSLVINSWQLSHSVTVDRLSEANFSMLSPKFRTNYTEKYTYFWSYTNIPEILWRISQGKLVRQKSAQSVEPFRYATSVECTGMQGCSKYLRQHSIVQVRTQKYWHQPQITKCIT